jgi:enamine deaminase RidA (YjgF/YER057c/UK114 family)
MSVRFSNPESVAVPDGQFSQAALVTAATSLLFISGQVARNAEGKTVGVNDMTAQARQVFKNLQAILDAHNSSFEKAVKATIYVTDMSRAHEVMAVRNSYYNGAVPASTFVAVTALNDPEWLLEIELIAAV